MRFLRDAKLRATAALPAAGATRTTEGIDLGPVPWPLVENVVAAVRVPATPALASGKAITVALHDSENNSSFTIVSGVPSQTITGGASGGAASEIRFVIPKTVRRYVRANVGVAADGGANTGVDFAFELVF